MEEAGNPFSEEAWSQTNDNTHPNAETPNEEGPEEEFASKVVRLLVNLWHFFDFFIGSTFMIYGIILWIEARLSKVVLASVIAIGLFLIIRACVGTYSLYKDFFNRFGMLLSGYQSVLMTFSLFITSIICFFERQKISPYLIRHKHDMHVPNFFLHFIEKHVHFLWILLLVLSVIEALRWISLLNYREYLLEDDKISIQLSLQAPTRNRQPWWWKPQGPENNQTGDLHEPLLEPTWTVSNTNSYQMDEGLDHDNNANTIWSSIFGRRAKNNRNPRDDGSVDFASVQEEWASRSEQDPLWWAREEGKADDA